MDRFEQLRTFVQVVDSGSFSAAADVMRLAKSAVSQRVSALEEELEAQLLKRTTRHLSLTEAGQAFYARCIQILADLSDAEATVADKHRGLTGKLRISAPMSFGISHLPAAINDFLKKYPELELDIDLDDRHANLVEEGFDLAIRISTLPDSSLMSRYLAPMHRVTTASSAYLKRNGTPRTPDELREHKGLLYSHAPKSGYWSYQDSTGKMMNIKVATRMRCNSAETLMGAAIAGLGVVVSPSFLVYRAIERGELVHLLPDYPMPARTIHAVYPPTRNVSRRVRVFVDFLVERFGDQPPWDQFLSQ